VVLGLLLAVAAAAEEPWERKPASAWSEEETLKLLNDSPWAQEEDVYHTSGRILGVLPGGQRVVYQDDPKLPPREYSVQPVALEPEQLRGVYGVRWSSATIIQQGLERLRELSPVLAEMQAPPPSPVVPAGVSVRTFAPGLDDRAAWQADTEAFRDHWGHHDYSFEKWEHYALKDERLDPSLFFLACDGDEIAGLTLGRLGMPEDPEMVWVDDMAVRRPWRRRGIALALLRTLFGECYRRGVRRIGLDVDAQNYTGAVQLYEKAGMHVYREAVGYEKRIR